LYSVSCSIDISGPALLLSEWVLLFLDLQGASASAGGDVVLRLIKEEPPMGPAFHRSVGLTLLTLVPVALAVPFTLGALAPPSAALAILASV
jgi:hypothetical protein